MTSGRDQVWAPGSIGVVDAMVRPGSPSISAEATLVYLCIFSYWGANGECYPSVNTIAEGVHLHRTTVIRKLDELEAAGLITRDTSKGKSTYYRLTPPWEWSQGATGSTERPVAQTDQSHGATCRMEQPHQSQRATTTGRTERPEVTHISNPMKNDDHHEEKRGNAESGTHPIKKVEDYLAGRMRALLASSGDLREIQRWLKLTGDELAPIFAGIDAGFETFQKDHPGQLPRRASWYSGYVEKAADRHKAGKEVDSGERRASGPGAGEGDSADPASGIGAERGRFAPGGGRNGFSGRRSGHRIEIRGAAAAATSKWVLPEDRPS